jgi:hypothetical protein
VETPALSNDMWFHLRMGQEFLDGWSVTAPGHLGVFDSAEWVPTQWAAQIAMALVVDRWELGALLWIYAALACVLVTGIYVVCRRFTAPLAAAIVTAAAWFALLPSLSSRPQVLSYLLFLVLVVAWHRQARDGRTRWWPVVLVWLWVPLHGMWIIGLVTLAVMAASTWLDHRPGVRGSLTLAGVPLAAALAALVTPVGLDAYRAVLGVGGRADYFAEWKHPNLLEGTNLGLALLLAVVLVIWARGPSVSWSWIAMLGLAAGFTAYSGRTVPFAVLLLAPLAAAALQTLLPRGGPPGRIEKTVVALAPVLALAVLAVQLPPRLEEPPAPAWVDERVGALVAGTTVLTTWNSGPYFLWAHPQVDIVMHGYGDVFTDEEIERNHTLSTVGIGWQEELDALDLELAVVDTDSRLAEALVEEAGWSVLEEDEEFLLLEPPAS